MDNNLEERISATERAAEAAGIEGLTELARVALEQQTVLSSNETYFKCLLLRTDCPERFCVEILDDGRIGVCMESESSEKVDWQDAAVAKDIIDRIHVTDKVQAVVDYEGLIQLARLACQQHYEKNPDHPYFVARFGHQGSAEPIVVEIREDGIIAIAIESECDVSRVRWREP